MHKWTDFLHGEIADLGDYSKSPSGAVGRGLIRRYVEQRRRFNQSESKNPTVYLTDIFSRTSAGAPIRFYDPFPNVLWYSIIPYELDKEDIEELETRIAKLE